MLTKSNRDLTDKVEEISIRTAESQITRRLQDLVADKAELINDSFFFFRERLVVEARYAAVIFSGADRLPPALYNPPRMSDDGKLSVRVLCPKSFSDLTASEKHQISKLANISNLLLTTVSRSLIMRSSTVAFDSGFSFIADRFSSSNLDENGEPIIFDWRKLDWYKRAKKSEELFFLGPTEDVFSDSEIVSFIVPFKDERGRFGGVAVGDMAMSDIENIVRRAVPDDEGIACLFNEKGELIFSTAKTGPLKDPKQGTANILMDVNEQVASLIRNAGANKKGINKVNLDGENYYVSYAPVPVNGWSLSVFYPEKTVFKPTELLLEEFNKTDNSMIETTKKYVLKFLLNLLILVVPIVLLLFFIAHRLAFLLTHSIKKLTEEVRNVDSDELIFKWTEHSEDEVELLADTFRHLTERLRNYVDDVVRTTAEKERMGTELSVATNIQANMLPDKFPPFPDRSEFEIFASMTPAKEVGGDFYDFFMVDKRHLAVVVADVSGKGVPAALFMVIGKTLIKDHTVPNADLGQVFTQVNDLLFAANGDGMFITAFEGVLDLYSGEFRYVNAGHEPPFICHEGVFVEKELDPCFVLAGMPGMKYQSGRLFLEPGDMFFQYTDGVTEATNAQEKLYGMKRLEEILNKSCDKIPCEVISAVKADVAEFVGDAPQFDDITMLCFEYKHRMEVGELMVSESLTVSAERENLSRVQEFVISVMKKGCASKEAQGQIDIATEEVFVNIASYAYPKETVDNFVWIHCVIECNEMTLTFKDKGVPYNPLEKKDPEIGIAVEDMSIGGFGIYMTKQLADSVEYEYAEGFNILRLKKIIA
jgi:sigma-B regulation protein RsbU (phosphoserine phosphatase)